MANVSCITKISYAYGLGGLSSSIRYATQGKPHNSDNGKIKSRAFVINGYNISDNPKTAYSEMKTTLNNQYINHMNISLIRDIQSFKGLDFRSKSDRAKTLKLDKQFIKRMFPHNQVLIVGHIDGKNHHIHFHNLVCSRRFDNGKSIANECSFYEVAPFMDKVLKDNGYKPLVAPHKSKINRNRGVYYHLFHGNSFIIYLQKQIENTSRHALTSNEFANILRKNNINVERFKMTDKNGHRRVKLYQRPTKDGSYLKLSNGKFARYRKHWSYSFNYHGIPVKVRDKKLGTDYSKSHLLKQFNLNYQRAIIPKKSRLHTLQGQRSIVSNKLSNSGSKPNFKPRQLINNSKLKKYIRNSNYEVQNEYYKINKSNVKDNALKQQKLAQLKKQAIIDNRIAKVQAEIDLIKEIKERLMGHNYGLNR